MNRKLLFKAIASYLAALLVWTILFYGNEFLKDVLPDIHLIFTATIISYILIRQIFNPAVIDFTKVFIRTLFRVWLLIFITFAISKSMDRIGILLSLTFIFGYVEGLLDINKWLESNRTFMQLIPKEQTSSKANLTIATIFLMSLIHILCAVTVMVFYLSFNMHYF
jgi:hypothetical protein